MKAARDVIPRHETVALSERNRTPWVDDTLRSVRPQDGGSAVGRDGKQVDDPNAHPEQLAIEPDPNRAFEHWDEYCRKIHGPKFAYEEPGSTSQLVMRYDQLHRLAGGPSSFFRPPYRAMVDPSKKLVGDPTARVPAYGDRGGTDWPTSPVGLRTTSLGQPQYADRIIADEQTAFRMVTRQIAREHIIIRARCTAIPLAW